MSIGYACLTVGVRNASFRTCTQRFATEEKLAEIIEHNLDALDNVLRYNIQNGVRIFRISSDIIPFASSPVNTLDWKNIYAEKLKKSGRLINENGIRVSMHPGQYTVLNSPDSGVVMRSVEELRYHADFLDCLGVGPENKMILHVGGAYGDKVSAVKRFEENYMRLPDNIKARLVIENDDRSYNISEVIEIGKKLSIPVVYDNLHNFANPSEACAVTSTKTCTGNESEDLFWIRESSETWTEKDGNQKIHYSQHAQGKSRGAHSQSISITEFMKFYKGIEAAAEEGSIREIPDIMLEVKDKNLSAIKCINCTQKGKRAPLLEKEWGRYKYSILEASPETYQKIRQMLKGKEAVDPVGFYELIEEGLREKNSADIGRVINAAQHVWGYFNETATEKEKQAFMRDIEAFKIGRIRSDRIKKDLWKLTEKYRQPYLLDSLYFV